MAIRQKTKKSPLTDFVSMIVPDRIEEAYDRVDAYFTEHLKLSFETPEGVGGVLNELIRDHGEPVRRALYALLCEQDSPLRKMTSASLADGGKSVVGLLVPVLVAQFALAPAVALLVATLVIKATASSGEQAVCEGMILQHRKVARVIRSREHARATSAPPRVHRSPLGATIKKESASRKKSSSAGSPGKTEGAKRKKSPSASQVATNENGPRVRTPYPEPGEKKESGMSRKPPSTSQAVTNESGQRKKPASTGQGEKKESGKSRKTPASTSAAGNKPAPGAGRAAVRKPAAKPKPEG